MSGNPMNRYDMSRTATASGRTCRSSAAQKSHASVSGFSTIVLYAADDVDASPDSLA